MGKYEDGLQPISPVRQPEETEKLEGKKSQEERKIKVELLLALDQYKMLERMVLEKYQTVTDETIHSTIISSISLSSQVSDLSKPTGTTFTRHRPGFEAEIVHLHV